MSFLETLESSAWSGSVGRSHDLGEYRLLENVPFIPVDVLQWALIYKILKQPKGYQMLVSLIKEHYKSVVDIVRPLAQAGTGNLVSAWTHAHLIAQILEHNYLIRKGGAKSIVDGASWITAGAWISGLIGGFSAPSSIAYSEKGEGEKSTKLSGLGTLASLFAK